MNGERIFPGLYEGEKIADWSVRGHSGEWVVSK